MPSYLATFQKVMQSPKAGAAIVSVPVSSSPLERFKSSSGKMQANADASIGSEIRRIVALPVTQDPTDEDIAAVSKWYFPDGYMKMWTEQVKAMIEFHQYGEVLGPIGVGRGKSLISVLCINDAFTLFGKKKILLLNPSHLVHQLRTTELPKYRKGTSINTPFYWLAEETGIKRMQTAKSRKIGCYVLSYDLLSGKEGAEILHAIKPDMIVGDEIHRVMSESSARGRRFREIVKTYSPSLVSLSGTMTQKSPKEYHHLAVNTLHERCFVPIPRYLSDEWAKVIDCDASNVDAFDPGQAPQPGDIRPLLDWGRKNFPGVEFTNDFVGFREAHRLRMQTTPGVIASKGKDMVGSSLLISNVPITKAEKEACQGWDALTEHIKNLVNLWVAPNGDELEHAMHLWRYRYELEGIGGYNDLSWPSIEKVAARRGISDSLAQDYLSRSMQHHRAHQEYAKELRSWLKHRAKTGMDTPMLLGQEMFRNESKHVGAALYTAWKEVKDAFFPEIIEREKKFVRVCDFRVKKIVEWAKQLHEADPKRAAIVWYYNRGVGEWLRDAFKEADVPYSFCPAGKEGRKRISDDTKRHCFTLATFKAFNEGLNIQKIHSRMLYAQWPRQAKIAEQSIGRSHRPGQPDDEVRVWGSFCSEFDNVLLAACLNDAAYIHQTTGSQKLLYADWDFKPVIVPYAVMQEWGAEPFEGNETSRKLLEDKFIEKE